jgi:hypothetical protein
LARGWWWGDSRFTKRSSESDFASGGRIERDRQLRRLAVVVVRSQGAQMSTPVMVTGHHERSERLSPPGCGGLVDRLTAWARSGLEAFHGLSLLQLCLVGALGLGLGYWALGLGFRFIRRAALTALLAIAVVAVVRLAFPGPFCAIRWPYPIAALCSR